jgi:hypothetical protein
MTGVLVLHHALLRSMLLVCLQELVKVKLSHLVELGQTWSNLVKLDLTAMCLQVFAKFDTSMEQLEPLSAELNVKALPVFRFYKVRVQHNFARVHRVCTGVRCCVE